MKTKYLSGLVLLVVACSGGQTTGGHGGQSTLELKRAAAEAHAKGQKPSADVCAAHGWYGDGECDTFCQDADTGDCAVPIDDHPVCAAFIELADGVCSRPADDPCRGQDPDCTVVPDPIGCEEILWPHDGKCDPSVPCAAGNDPDCLDHPPPGPICPAVLMAPDGVCKTDPNNPCVEVEDPDCHDAPGPDCPPSLQAPDGVCKTDPNNVCIGLSDPDCVPVQPVPPPEQACTLISEIPDGVCSRPADDPCISQDPDCIKK